MPFNSLIQYILLEVALKLLSEATYEIIEISKQDLSREQSIKPLHSSGNYILFENALESGNSLTLRKPQNPESKVEFDPF